MNNKLINIAILIFWLASLLYNVAALQMIGFVLLITVISVLFVISMSTKQMKIKQHQFFLILLYLAIVYTIGLLRGISFRSIEVFVCLLISIVVLNTFAIIDLSSIKSKYVKTLIIFEIPLLFVPYLLGVGYNPIDGGYKSFFTTTTFLGIFSCMQIELCLLIYMALKKKIWLYFIPFFILLTWLSMVRTAYIGIIVIIICFYFRNRFLLQTIIMLRMSKWLLFATIMTIVLIYPNLDSFDWYEAVSAFVYVTTGKILMSGRNEDWQEGFKLISNNPMWGHGLDTSIFDIQLHNSYLQLMLESGVMGIVGVFLLLNIIINNIIKTGSPASKTIFFFTLVNLLMCTTEVMLLHGQMVLQIIMWGIMGVGLNTAKSHNLTKKRI